MSCFIITCGTHTFQSLVSPFENLSVQCQNCGNFSGKITKRWEWFTLCFIPLIPFSFKPWQEITCPICNFHQDIKYRPDVQQQMNSGGGGGQQIPMQNQGSAQGGPPPQQYEQGGQPVYK